MVDRAASVVPPPDIVRSSSKISARDLEVVFGTGGQRVHALGPVTLDVAEGEFVCVVGPSGCGKSTLVRVIGGLQLPTRGRLEVHLRGSTAVPIATVFQDYGIFPWKTVEANVQFALTTNGVPRREAKARVGDILRRLGLSGFEKSYPRQLSGGMRQRVAIARALVLEPEILLMDEPFASLDAQMREVMQEELLAICQQDRRTVVFVTHSLEEAVILGDRVLVFTARPGTVLDEAVVSFPRPRTPALRDTAEFGELRGRLWDHLRSEVDRQLTRGPLGVGNDDVQAPS